MSILMTGGSSLLGSYVLADLIKTDKKILLLCRQKSLPNLSDAVKNHKQIEIIIGDIAQPYVLNDESSIKKLLNVTDFVHMAASYEFSDSLSRAYLNNVVGTQNILDLAAQLPKLERLHAISTLAIAGNFGGRFLETMFNVGQEFSNPYASTKFRAEGLLGSWNRNDVKRIIYRLGTIVGDSKSGYINRFDGPYLFYRSLMEQKRFWRFLSLLGNTPIPYDSEAQLPFIPVDVAGEFISHMISSPNPLKGKLRSYHLVGSHVKVEHFLNCGLEAFGYRSKAVPLRRSFNTKMLLKRYNIPLSLLEYVYQKTEFDDAHLRADFPTLKAPNFDEYSEKMFSFLKGLT